MENGPGWRWYGQEFKAKLRRHVDANLDAAAIFLTNDIQNSFGHSGVTGTRSGATQSQRAANRSKPWGPPNVDSGHLRRNVGWDRLGNMRRRIGTSIGNKESVGYAMWLEFGTGPSPGRYVPALGVRIKSGTHPGILPRPFLRPALSRNADKLRQIIGRPMR